MKLGYARVSTDDKPAAYWPFGSGWMRVEREWAAWMLQMMRQRRHKGSCGVGWWRAWRNAGGIDDQVLRDRREARRNSWHLHLEAPGDIPMEFR